MNLISREELKDKIESGDDIKLVMVLGEWAFQMAHIPGSMSITKTEEALVKLSIDDDIVVYCSNITCIASISAFQILNKNGYKHVQRYAGGVEDWQAAGYPIEGSMAE